MASPPPTSLVPAPTVWPPSNPSGTVIPFPLPWGQTGCCPPGGMDALMKCYCDIQQASAFIGQIMLDQINNNPAIIAAIIAALEKSGSNVPLLGVTNGADAQPGQVGEWDLFGQNVAYTAAFQTQTITMGVLQPGDWDVQINAYCPNFVTAVNISLSPAPVGLAGTAQGFFISDNPGGVEQVVCMTPWFRMLTSVPTLMAVQLLTNQSASGPAAGTLLLELAARRRR